MSQAFYLSNPLRIVGSNGQDVGFVYIDIALSTKEKNKSSIWSLTIKSVYDGS